MNQRDAALVVLDSGKHAFVPGQPDESELVRRIAAEDEADRMPPEGKPLTAAQVDLIRQWVAQGAKWEEHWAFQPVSRPTIPEVKHRDWVRNPIDAFILHRLEQNDLEPAPPAGKAALIRRAYYDLTGLPPLPAEVDSFLADNTPEAYERLIDRLLASPQYGERWGRPWLDAVRYAETNSFERDGPKPHAWRYRDYVIRSFNSDKPYAQFVREQLAGDEMTPVTPERLIATGFYRLGLWDDEPADRLQAEYDTLDDLVTTTGQVFLGLTVNCARCHDHKIDPIPQHDYYSLLAFFRGIKPMTTTGPNIERPLFASDAERLAYDERARQHESRRNDLQAKVTALESDFVATYRKSQAAEATAKNDITDRQLAELMRLHAGTLLGEAWYSDYRHQFGELERLKRELPPADYALCVTEAPQPPETYVLLRGNAHVPGAKVEPAFPAIISASRPVLPAASPDRETAGRRSVLADWIASPDNRLTARVMVNRIWQHHFGRGIVRSPNNFGYLGDRPTHPELLDWLAGEFIASGWRIKPLHRLIMLSNAYQMSSQPNPSSHARDSNNDLFSQFNMRRLSAEEIRDAMQAVAGGLNLRMYGPSYYPKLSAEVMATQSAPGKGWGNSPPDEQSRRSIYIHVKRSLITPLLADFDFPDTDGSCEARFVTTQPAQALGMLNGDFVHEQAAKLAERLRREAGDDRASQVRLALRLALSREADEASVARGVALIEQLEKEHGRDARLSLDYYCLLVLNLNEFIYLD